MQINKKLNIRFLSYGIFVLFLFSILTISCNDDSLVGSSLLDKDGIDVNFTDSTEIKTLNIKGVDSILMNDATNFTQELFLGEIHDEYFGEKRFISSFEVSLGSSSPSFYDYDNEEFAEIDSVVLILNLNENLFYGDTNAVHQVQAFQFDQKLPEDVVLYSSDEIIENPQPISELQSLKPNLQDYVLDYNDDTVTTGPSIRIKLNNDFGQMIINDTTSVKRDSSLRELIKGIKLVSTVDETSVIPLDMAVKSLTDIGNKLFFFYRDTVPKSYAFILGGIRHNEVISDISGTDFETALNNQAVSDSLLYLQGFGCGDTRIEFPNANFSNYGNILVKKAELEVTISEIPGDEINKNPINLLFLFTEDNDGNRTIIDEVLIAQSASLLTDGFGGAVKTELDSDGAIVRRYYTLNITGYFQDLIRENSSQKNELILGAAVPSISPERTILYGPGNSEYPMKLKLTYSIPN